ncbi:hypothetical protein GTR04_0865 [Trichophyton interdigitale]|nr:hypothetical protein GY631_1341 [Trichophyton interdigitale]KAG5217327.1 hypothetical protein GY632_6666 [Trichophyton interdigitale]KAG8211773.1 hypothetical protein GTR04_0865 [Trichophyton interdigitale]
MTAVQVVQGFSVTNRWLLYTSMMLTPAQFVSGIGNNCPSNIGFLAYNWYTQIQWYRAVRAKQLHALSLLPVYFNFIYAITYFGGVSSGNLITTIILTLGSAGVMILNTVSAWVSWKTNLPEGIGEYQFFFFGWRTLTKGWHTFFLLWQIADSILAFSFLIGVIQLGIAAYNYRHYGEDGKKVPWYLNKYIQIPLGSAIMMLFFGWMLILWTELIVARNHIQSETDMVAIYLFIAQTVALVLPSASTVFGCITGRKKERSQEPPPQQGPKKPLLERVVSWMIRHEEEKNSRV